MTRKQTLRGTQSDDWHELGFSWWTPDVDGTLYINRTGQMAEIPDGLDVDEDKRYSTVPIASARMQFRAKVTDELALVSLDESDGIDADELANGVIYPTLSAEQTELLAGGVFDVEATSDGGQVKTIATGNYIFTEDVTR